MLFLLTLIKMGKQRMLFISKLDFCWVNSADAIAKLHDTKDFAENSGRFASDKRACR